MFWEVVENEISEERVQSHAFVCGLYQTSFTITSNTAMGLFSKENGFVK